MAIIQEAPRIIAPIITKPEEVITAHLLASAGFGCAEPCPSVLESERHADRVCSLCDLSSKPPRTVIYQSK